MERSKELAASTESLFRGTTEGLPSRVNIASHIAPENYALERERIFRRSWLNIGQTQKLPHKGSYFVYDVPTFNYSLLVVRGQDDVVRVFHNICRHRGNKLVRDGAGTRAVPIRWVGHRRIEAERHPRPWLVRPVRIRRDALADGVGWGAGATRSRESSRPAATVATAMTTATTAVIRQGKEWWGAGSLIASASPRRGRAWR